MSESTIPSTELTSQYLAQVAGDLERNAKEQERIAADIAALQSQLVALQHDHTVLVSLHEALSTVGGPVAGAPSVPRQTAAARPGAAKRAGVRKPPARSRAAESTAARKLRPTLVELVRDYLTEQNAPRSAAETCGALAQAHTDRRIQTNVVRTTLEGLVAKGHAHRMKQGSSVFYTPASAGPGRRTEPAAVGPEPRESAESA